MTIGDSASVSDTTNGDTPFVVGNNGTAVLTQSGNSSINTGSGEFWVGNNPGNASGVTSGVYNLSGGSLTVGSYICIGRRYNATGVVNMTGGVITETSNRAIHHGRGQQQRHAEPEQRRNQHQRADFLPWRRRCGAPRAAAASITCPAARST